MATGDFLGNLKQKVRSLYNNFFYEGAEAPAPRGAQDEYAPDQPYVQQAPQGYQQPGGSQAPYAQQPQNAYQQPQNYAPQGGGYAAPGYQPQPQPRNRRAQQHAGQAENNVVDFGAYQQQSQQPYQPQHQAAYQQPGYQPAYQQPQNYQQAQPQTYQQNYQQPAPAQEAQAQQPPQPPQAAFGARVINARGMGDCRGAITLLRNGDAVLIVLENVSDPAEMRRLVDTLSGACYSLTATITKVSRYGVYLLAPQTMAVYADQATNQMNSPGRAPLRGYQPGYGAPQRPAYQPQAPAMNAYPPQQGFTQRMNTPEEAAQPFYARTAPQAAQVPSFSAQPAGYGYAPDEAEASAVDQ